MGLVVLAAVLVALEASTGWVTAPMRPHDYDKSPSRLSAGRPICLLGVQTRSTASGTYAAPLSYAASLVHSRSVTLRILASRQRKPKRQRKPRWLRCPAAGALGGRAG